MGSEAGSVTGGVISTFTSTVSDFVVVAGRPLVTGPTPPPIPPAKLLVSTPAETLAISSEVLIEFRISDSSSLGNRNSRNPLVVYRA